MCYLLFVVDRSLRVVCRLSFAVACLLFVVRCLLFVVSWVVVRRCVLFVGRCCLGAVAWCLRYVGCGCVLFVCCLLCIVFAVGACCV